MNWKRFPQIVLGIVAAVILVAVVVVTTVDFGRFNHQIANYASDYLGRSIAFDQVSITIGTEIRVAANGIRLASTDWSTERDLLSVDHVAVVIDTLSIFSQEVVVEDLTVKGVRAHLVQDSDGRDNYTLPVFEEPATESEMTLFLTRASITDLALLIETPAFNPPLSFTSSSIVLGQRADDNLEFELVGALNDAVVGVDGFIGTMDDLIAATNIRFDMVASVGEITVDGSGLIDDLTEPRLPTVNLAIDGPTAEYLTDILEFEPITTGPMAFESRIAPGVDGMTVDVDGVYGEFSLHIAASLRDLQSFDDVRLAVDAAGPSLATLGRIAGRDDLPTLPFNVEINLQQEGSNLAVSQFLLEAGEASIRADANVPGFPGIDGATANFELRGSEFGRFNRLLGLPGRLTGPFEVTASLVQSRDRGALEARLVAEAIQAELTADISDREDFGGTVASIEARGDDVSILAGALGSDGLPALGFGARVDFDVIDEGISIRSGVASLGDDEISFEGLVGRDPLSSVTRLTFAATLADPGNSLQPFDIDATLVPAGELNLTGEIARSEEAFLIEALSANIADIELMIDGRIADDFERTGMQFNLLLAGTDLALLIPPEIEGMPGGPFRIGGSVALDAQNIEVTGLHAELAGVRVDLSLSTPLDSPFEQGTARLDAEGSSIARLFPAAGLPEDQPFNIEGEGLWREDRITLNEVALRAGEASFEIDGSVALPPDTGDNQLVVNGHLTTLRGLQFLTDRPLPDEPVTLRGEFAGNPDRLEVSLQEFTLGRSTISGTATIQPESESRPISILDVELRSSLVDLVGMEYLFTPAEADPASTVQADTDRMIPDMPIPNDLFPPLQASVDLKIDRLLVRSYDLNDVVLRGSLADGALNIEEFGLLDHQVHLDGYLRLLPVNEGLAIELKVDGSQMIFGLPAETDEERQQLPRYDATIKLASQGTTLREHASGATGYVKVVSGEGKLDMDALRILSRDFAAQVFKTINPFSKNSRYSKVQCLGVLIEISDGIAFGEPAMILQTDKVNIAGVGRVDLTTEKLNASFNTRARKGLGISMSDIVSPYTEVRGTLASPHLQLNSTSAIFRGSTIFATGGLSFLVKKAGERLVGQNPCRKEIGKAEADILERGL